LKRKVPLGKEGAAKVGGGVNKISNEKAVSQGTAGYGVTGRRKRGVRATNLPIKFREQLEGRNSTKRVTDLWVKSGRPPDREEIKERYKEPGSLGSLLKGV